MASKLACTANAETITSLIVGLVVGIADGDTITTLVDSSTKCNTG